MKGLIVEKSKKYYILLTPTGEYKKISGTIDKEIGEESDIPAIRVSYAKRLTVLAAAIAVVFLVQSIYAFFGPSRIYGYVTVDINPSAEFAISYNDMVLSAKPLNEEGEYILAGVDCIGRKIEDVLADYTKQAIKHEYITNSKQNKIVIALVPKNGKHSNSGAQKLEQLKQKEEQVLKEAGENAMIETLILDMKTRKEAESKGISSAKLDNEMKSGKTDLNNATKNDAGSSENGTGAKAENALKNTGKGNNKASSANNRHNDSNNSKNKKDPEKEKGKKNTGNNNGNSHKNGNPKNAKNNDKSNNNKSNNSKNNNNKSNNDKSYNNKSNYNKKNYKNEHDFLAQNNKNESKNDKSYVNAKSLKYNKSSWNYDESKSNKVIKGNKEFNKNNGNDKNKWTNGKGDDNRSNNNKNKSSKKYTISKNNIKNINDTDIKNGQKDRDKPEIYNFNMSGDKSGKSKKLVNNLYA